MEKMRLMARRYFSGEISTDDERELFAFVAGSDQGRRLFEECRTEWERSGDTSPAVNDAWERLHARINIGETAVKSRPRFRAELRGAAAAAVIAAMILLGARFYDRLAGSGIADYYSVTTKNGDRSTIMLPDGSQIKLYASSTVCYAVDFNAKNRVVELSGAAYFDVSPNDKHVFTVKTGNCSVVAKGTRFDVSAYPQQSRIITKLLEGAVDFVSPQGITMMDPGQALSYDRFTETATISQIDTNLYQAWIDGTISYKDIPIGQLCANLSKLYGVEIIPDERLKEDKTHVTIHLSNQESLESVLAALDLILSVSVEREGNSIRLSPE